MAWCDWVLGFDGFDQAHCLAANGWANNLPELARDATALLDCEGDENLQEITKTLLAACENPPKGAEALAVSDGTPPGDDDEDDDADDDGEDE